MTTFTKSLLAGIAALALGAAVQAAGSDKQPGPPMFGPHGMGPMGMMGMMGPGPAALHLDPTDLDLTADQTSQWEKMRSDYFATIHPLMDQHRTLAEEMHTALDAPNPDAQAIGEKMIALYGLMQKARAAGDDLESRFVAILDPDQKAKYDQLKADGPQTRRPYGMHHRFGPGGPNGQPAPPDPDGGR